MLRNCFLLVALFGCSGLAACDSPDLTGSEQSDQDLNIRLNRLADGDLEYCDEATGECRPLPYDGQCAAIEVSIDPATGRTCETCLLDDGTSIDQGCDEVSVGCVLVTLPDPDCVVCAFVDGDILFSTCAAGDPVCATDLDCSSDAGSPGSCVDGECVRESDPCRGYVCPSSQHCEPGAVDCSRGQCRASAACVSNNRDCQTDDDCPQGLACTLICPLAEPNQPDGDPATGTCAPDDPSCGECVGICEPLPTNECEGDDDCPDGNVCELYDALEPQGCDPASGMDCSVSPVGVCVPARRICETNDDCASDSGEQAWCIENECVSMVDCDPNHAGCEMLPPTCPDGEVVSVVGGCFGPCVPAGACLPAIAGCSDSSDCGPDEVCVVECWACESGDPACAGCEGRCEAPTPGCATDADCGPNEQCVSSCWDCLPEDPDCVGGCESYCVPLGGECQDDASCVDPSGIPGTCVGGRCYVEPLACLADSDCPDGQVCSFDGRGCNGQAESASCGGVCTTETSPTSPDCVVSGCSMEVCSDEDVATSCEDRPEYSCFERAICERQEDGICGWTLTAEAEQCLAEHGVSSGTNP